MEMAFRWYGMTDSISLEFIGQIPGMKGIVTAIYDIPVGEVWPLDKILELKSSVEKSGLHISVIESVPVHEDIKLGRPTKDKYIENYKETIKNLGETGIKVVCYNFMPVFDWTRSDLAYQLADGSTTLIYNQDTVNKMDPLSGDLALPGWDASYTKNQMETLIKEYKELGEEKLWENLEYFIKNIIPVAETSGVKMAIHPDDPPWSIFGLPRIITCKENLKRFLALYDSSYHGITFCTGSLGCTETNDLVDMIKYFSGEKKRIHFAHLRNVKWHGNRSFYESAHPSEYGSLDMYKILKALLDAGFDGSYRSDHGRMIWKETGKPGYGLYDRALGAVYIHGLIEAITKSK
ncbi:mannonate dehydratase UxuA [Clostridium aceticum]|uniref:Mannonate dehydratase n=1 Tax=Clostridium aceticum TaxID=84022 RepID=A0A0D8I8C7_9CLOT|nr:mannonate dehydratase [Clostridium aceticum]AKL95879.1 mannonate dehydratase UxuA [Clostridium aceticum]KJF26535.1 mannonate dehydratase [Clostridium aceticum]